MPPLWSSARPPSGPVLAPPLVQCSPPLSLCQARGRLQQDGRCQQRHVHGVDAGVHQEAGPNLSPNPPYHSPSPPALTQTQTLTFTLNLTLAPSCSGLRVVPKGFAGGEVIHGYSRAVDGPDARGVLQDTHRRRRLCPHRRWHRWLLQSCRRGRGRVRAHLHPRTPRTPRAPPPAHPRAPHLQPLAPHAASCTPSHPRHIPRTHSSPPLHPSAPLCTPLAHPLHPLTRYESTYAVEMREKRKKRDEARAAKQASDVEAYAADRAAEGGQGDGSERTPGAPGGQGGKAIEAAGATVVLDGATAAEAEMARRLPYDSTAEEGEYEHAVTHPHPHGPTPMAPPPPCAHCAYCASSRASSCAYCAHCATVCSLCSRCSLCVRTGLHSGRRGLQPRPRA